MTQARPRHGPGGLTWLVAGRLAMTASNAALMLLVALVFMDGATFGTFAVAISLQIVVSRAVLLGLDQGVVRMHTVAQDRTEPVRAAVSIAGGLGLALLVLGAVLAPLQPGTVRWPIVVAVALGAVGSAWFDLGCAIVLARLRYRAAGLLTAAMPGVRLAVTLAACATTHNDSLLPIVAYGAATFGAGVVLLGAVVRRFGWHAGTEMFWRELHYTKWVGMSDAATVLSQVLALVVLKRCGQDAEAGRFAFAMQAVQVFVAVYVAFYQSLLPRAARLGGVDAVPIFLRQSLRMAARLALTCAALACVAALVLPMVLEELRPELTGFGPGFLGLSAFAVVMFFEAPLGVVCQYLLRPRLQLLALLVRCAAVGALALWLVPGNGALGAGLAQFGGGVLGAMALLWLVLSALDEAKGSRACAAS